MIFGMEYDKYIERIRTYNLELILHYNDFVKVGNPDIDYG